MPWVLLVVAGLLEVAWASLLPATNGLTRPLPTAGFLAALTASMVLLARAAEHLPLGTAYTVWVGIGAVGATVVGLVAEGRSHTQILSDYPDLEPDDIQQALSYAAEAVRERQIPVRVA